MADPLTPAAERIFALLPLEGRRTVRWCIRELGLPQKTALEAIARLRVEHLVEAIPESPWPMPATLLQLSVKGRYARGWRPDEGSAA